MKKLVIIRAAGNELANQLWNYASIYAYSLERKYILLNPSFFEYGNSFVMKSAPNPLFKAIFFDRFNHSVTRKTSLKRRVWRKIYKWYSTLILFFFRKYIIIASGQDVHYLPPTNISDDIARLEANAKTIYLDGWLFRNPVGLEKYRNEINEYFKPKEDILSVVATYESSLRAKFKKIIGVHIRQGDYKTWRGGAYLIPQKRVREILDEYIASFDINMQKTCFLLTSDGTIDAEVFSGLNIEISRNEAVADLFLLSKADTIIGSNSTFNAFASYYGNVPLIVMQNKDMDWSYYKDRVSYFENKYSTTVHY